jgi:hypothetical protein
MLVFHHKHLQVSTKETKPWPLGCCIFQTQASATSSGSLWVRWPLTFAVPSLCCLLCGMGPCQSLTSLCLRDPGDPVGLCGNEALWIKY